MPQNAIAFPAAPTASRAGPFVLPDVEDTIAAVTAAGRLIADLRTRLELAERTIAALKIDKRALEAELSTGQRVHPLRAAIAPKPDRSHVDEALATLTRGLGPSIVRAAPQG